MAENFRNPFLSGFFGSQEAQRRNDLAQMSQLGGMFGIQDKMDARAERQADAPLRRQLLEAQIKKAGQPQYQQIGSGLLGPNNEIIAPPEKPKTVERWSEPYNLNGAMVQKNEATGQVRQAVTPVTIEDPNNPNATIIIDGRTKAVLGKGPKLTATGTNNLKQQTAMQGLGSDLQSAEDLLMGNKRDSEGNVTTGRTPTGSGLGTAVDAIGSVFGVAVPGAPEARALEVVSGRLVQKVPRFEGPQSDKDVKLYKEMAGDAGNTNKTREERLAAVREMRKLYAGYEDGTRGRIVQGQINNQGRRSTDGSPGLPSAADIDAELARRSQNAAGPQ